MKRIVAILNCLICIAGVTVLSVMLQRVTSILCQIGIGLMLGIFLSSLHESIVHQYLGHAKTKTREFWRRHPRLFLPLIEGFFLHHIVHHGKTYRDGYLVQFGETLNNRTVDEWAPEAFYRLFSTEDQAWVRRVLPANKIVQHLHAADYGLGAVSSIKFAATTFPVVAVLFTLTPVWMAVSAALPMIFVYPAMSNALHRHLMHIPQDGSATNARHNDTSWFGFVKTVCMKALERWHWMHHEYIYCNYNLLVLADFFRWGARRKPSPKDLQKMAKEGLAMDTWWSLFARPRKTAVPGLE